MSSRGCPPRCAPPAPAPLREAQTKSARSIQRAMDSLLRQGLLVEKHGPVYRVRQQSSPHAPWAEVLLPDSHALDGKALRQLAAFAAVSHPNGGRVQHAFATPDFHPGSVVPIGCVLATSPDMIIPSAIGTDIGCGMRLHTMDLSVDRLLANKAAWLELIKGDLLLGTRDLPMRVAEVRAMFQAGPLGWLEALRQEASPLGLFARLDLPQLEAELERSFGLGSQDGDLAYAPQDMLPTARDKRDVIRDCYLGTIGGGNHFVELQVVEEILDRKWAYRFGLKQGQVAVMAHSGSRRVGMAVGSSWMQHAEKQWPEGVPFPGNGVFALGGESAFAYLSAMNTAANYASVNRLLLAEMVRDRFRQVFSRTLEMPLVFDTPHNIVTFEDGHFIHRKGATPAFEGEPVLIPGSMGQSSYVMVGHGNSRYLQSASHGAGRQFSRGKMFHRAKQGKDLGLAGVECITLKEERLIQEAPAAYKDIGPVVQVQADAGIAHPVARLRPLLTLKA